MVRTHRSTRTHRLCLEALEDRCLLSTMSLDWVRQFGSNTPANDFAQAVDSDGNIYLFGQTDGALPGQADMGTTGDDTFLRKYDASGTELWTRQFGTSTGDFANGIAVDASGVYVVGRTAGALPGQTNLGSHDAFLRKYDANGDEIWTRQFGTVNSDQANGVAVDAGGVYVVGSVVGALPGQVASGNHEAFVRKYDSDGNEVWTRQFGNYTSNAYAVAADASGLYVAGEIGGALPGQTGSGGTDAYVRKYDPSGNHVWSRQFGATIDGSGLLATAYGVALDATGVYLAGNALGALPGQSMVGGNFDFDAFARKYDLDGNVAWTRQFGTAADDFARSISADASGVYVAGFVDEALPGQVFAGARDAFVRKYNADGTEVWTRQFGTPSGDEAFGVSANDSEIYVVGFTQGSFPGFTNAGVLRDTFVRKYDINGAEAWTRQFGGVLSTLRTEQAAAVDAAGNAYVAGYADGALPGQTSLGSDDAFVRKYDAAGNEMWTRQFGSSAGDRATGVAVDAAGNVYVAGFAGAALPGQTPVGGNDAFVRKYDASGGLLWTRQFGTTSSDSALAIAVDALGVYVAGTTSGTLPGQPTRLGASDAFLRKYDANGAELWTRQFGSAGIDQASGVAVDVAGNIYAAGRASAALAGQPFSGGLDAFVRQYSPSGVVGWTRQFGSSDNDQAMGIAVHAAGVYLSGSTSGTLPGQATAGGTDAFVQSYTTAGVAQWTRQFGTSGADQAAGISADATGLYVTGEVGGALPGQVSAGGTDAFVRAYDANGIETTTLQFGTAGADRAFGVANDAAGLFVAGSTTGAFAGQAAVGLTDAFVAKVAINAPPTAVADAYSVDEGGTLAVSAPGVLANDTDPESSPLTAILVSGPAHAAAGGFTLHGAGSFSYTPAPGFFGTDSFVYRAFDGADQSADTTVTITVNPFNVVVDLTTSQAFLDQLTRIAGDLIVVNIAGREFLIIPNLEMVGGDVTITGNDSLLVIDLGALTSAGGSVTISGNPALTTMELSSLETVQGDLVISSNPSAQYVDAGSLTTAGGDVVISSNDSATYVDVGSLTDVGGDFGISTNPSVTTIDVGALVSTGGDVVVSSNPSVTIVDVGALTDVGGDVVVSSNPSVTIVDVGALTDVGGDVVVSSNPSITIVDADALTDVGGDFVVSSNPSVTTIDVEALVSTGGDVSISDNDSATSINLSSLTTVAGTLTILRNIAALTINLGALTSTTGSVRIIDNGIATPIDLFSLLTVGGDVEITGNHGATAINITALAEAGGNVVLTNNDAAISFNLNSLAAVSGDLAFIGNSSASGIAFPSVTSVGGNVYFEENGAAVSIALPSLTTTGAGVYIIENDSAQSVDLNSLGSVGGDLSIVGNDAATTIGTGAVVSVGGNVYYTENDSAQSVDFSSLTTTGAVYIIENDSAQSVALPSLITTGGNVYITENDSAQSVALPSLTTTGGNVYITENDSAQSIDLSALTSADGSVTVAATDSVTAATGDQGTTIVLASAAATMTAELPDSAFTDNVQFTALRLDPATLDAEDGEDAAGEAATIDPLVAYQFSFDIPTLNSDATLSFDIYVASLAPSERADFLTALDAGKATVAVKNDSPGSVYQEFAGATITRLDADGNPLPEASATEPAIVRFEAIVGHFSTYAVVILNHVPTANAGLDQVTVEDALVAFDGAGSFDPDGDALTYSWDFGDGATATGPTPTHVYAGNGPYVVTLTVDDGQGGVVSDSMTVTVNNLVDVSGRLFDDKDNDGIYEPDDGDAGIGDVKVQLFDEASGAWLGTRTTAADGAYFFDVNLAAGSYRLVAAPATGFLDGRETAGNLGGVVDNSQDSNQIAGIHVGEPGTTADAVDYLFAGIRPSQALGMVWRDDDNDGQVDFGEPAIAGVAIELTGFDDRGQSVNRSAVTDADGIYAFVDLRPSDAAGYTIRELPPAGFVDGLEALGTVNGATVGNASVNDSFSALVLPAPGAIAENYNFGERSSSEGGVVAGQAAGIGFWQNKNGQKLIHALNGGSTSTQLGDWLALTFPNMYGADAGANNLAGKSNAEVAAFYKTLFARTAQSAAGGGPAKMDAQVMATALAVYVTNQTLAGTTATAYGFLVTASGIGSRTFNVGESGAAFGVANDSDVTVLDLLLAVNSRSQSGLLFDLDGDGDACDALETVYRVMASSVFSGINEAGDI